jgi:hypothetical protein
VELFPAALYDKLPVLNDLKVQWTLVGVSTANLYAPTLTTTPNPIVRIDASVPASRVAEVLGGEIVQKGANLDLWQTKGNAALYNTLPHGSQRTATSAGPAKVYCKSSRSLGHTSNPLRVQAGHRTLHRTYAKG